MKKAFCDFSKGFYLFFDWCVVFNAKFTKILLKLPAYFLFAKAFHSAKGMKFLLLPKNFFKFNLNT